MAVKTMVVTAIAAVAMLTNTSNAKTIAIDHQVENIPQTKLETKPIVLARFGGGNSPGGGLDSRLSRRDHTAGPFYTQRGNRFGFGAGRRFLDYGLKKEFDRDGVHLERGKRSPIIFQDDKRTDR